MKYIFTILLLCSFSFPGICQNWKTVAINDTTYFATGSGQLRFMVIDSARQLNTTDSVFYFFKSVRDTVAGHCMDTAADSWLGSRMVRRSNGDEVYFNSFKDSVIVKTGAQLGAAWNMAKDTAGRIFTATVSQLAVTMVDSVMDSTKTITIQAYQNNIPAASLYNNRVFVLSKNHGWLATADMYLFPNPYPATSFGISYAPKLGTRLDSGTHVRLPKSFNNMDMGSIDNFYLPGNVCIYSETSVAAGNMAGGVTKYMDSVMSVIATSSSGGVATVHHQTYNDSWYVSGIQVLHNSNSTDAILQITYTNAPSSTSLLPVYVKNTIFPERKYKNIANGNTLWSDTATVRNFGISVLCNGKYSITSNDFGNTLFVVSPSCLSQASMGIGGGTTLSTSFIQGLGDVVKDKRTYLTNGVSTVLKKYEYLSVNGCKQGNYYSIVGVTDLKKEKISIKLYPNPAQDVVTLTLPQATDGIVNIYDITGRNVLSKTIKGKTVTLPLIAIGSGIYIVQLKTGSNEAGFTRLQVVK